MNKIYRFRDIEKLIGNDYKELENQEIFLSKMNSLNDPMEGISNIIWKGDDVLYRNLLTCFYRATYFVYTLIIPSLPKDSKINQSHVWAQTSAKKNLDTKHYNAYMDGLQYFLNLKGIKDTIKFLSSENFEVNSNELKFLLKIISPLVESIILKITYKVLKKNKLESHIDTIIKDLNSHIDNLSKPLKDKKYSHDFMWIFCNRYLNINPIIERNTNSLKSFDSDFVPLFVSKLESFINPSFRIACFTSEKGVNNSSVWSSYADSHKGVALKFNMDFSYKVKLTDNQTAEYFGLRPVNYKPKINEINFFKSMHELDAITLNEWKKDIFGNKTKIDIDIAIAIANSDKDLVLDVMTTKTIDWKHEDEFRLFVTYRNEEYKHLKAKYDFDLLEGVIFGINTKEEDKVNIVDIITRKCHENNIKEFCFYQAYYDRNSGKILNTIDPYYSFNIDN
jgi:hypothetical protein